VSITIATFEQFDLPCAHVKSKDYCRPVIKMMIPHCMMFLSDDKNHEMILEDDHGLELAIRGIFRVICDC
jgi:hypothetical protein